ncbi:cytochrome P450 [Actinospongicola halichondriae]|uniref:cytochrome P450 n=1 Tax=Actinospongicola halichondriae TaxID=3236844 RepID=UPI003D487A56
MSDTTDIPGTETPLFNPFEDGYAQWPYDQFARLREAGPVLPSPLGGWQLFSYDDCFQLLREPGTSVEEENIAEPIFDTAATAQFARDHGFEPFSNRSILNIDPPDHTRLRKLVARVFTPRAIERLRPEVQRLVDEAMRDIGPGDRFDLIATLAFPLPFQVISLMLGMPEGKTEELRGWSHTLAGSLDPILSDDQMLATLQAGQSMRTHLQEVIAWKRANPADDLLSAMIEQSDDGDALTDEELLHQLSLLFIAGHETTVNLIGNGMLQLLRHPEQLGRLRDDAELIGDAVEECLRFDPPVQMTRRITMAPFEASGHTIEPGTFVMAMTAAANRDPARWGDNADEFDITRKGASHHLSFGSGIHHCLGAALARMEAQVAIGTLVQRHPGLSLDGEPVHNGRVVLRGLDELPLRG